MVEAQVKRNATFATLLSSHDLGDVAYSFVEAMRPVFDPRSLQVGHPYTIIYGADGAFRRFEYHVDEDQYLEVVPRPGPPPMFEASLLDYQKQREHVAMRGTIDREHNSLMAAMSAGGGHDLVAMAMAEVFAGFLSYTDDQIGRCPPSASGCGLWSAYWHTGDCRRQRYGRVHDV